MGIIHSRRRYRVHEDKSSKRIRLMKEEYQDFISKLPDEIIISILSRLDTIEQQAKTSAVARRWRYLWKFSTTNLRFVLDLNRGSESVCRANQMIKALGASTKIATLTVLFGSCDQSSIYQRDAFDEWLNLALQKRVQCLDMLLWSKAPYSLNNSLVMRRIRNKSLVLASLKSLRLSGVDVSGENLECILYSASPLLEELSILSCGPSLVNFTISGWSLKLKHFEFRRSSHFKHLDIHDVNLESLKYAGYGDCLTIRDTPCIVEACFPDLWDSKDMNFAYRILSNLPRLEMLVWMPCPGLRDQVSNQFTKFPNLWNLKKLKLDIGFRIFCIRLCALLLDASPLLCEFEILFNRLKESDNEDKVSRLKHPHQSLTVVEIVGFIGCEVDLGVALYLIENIASLEMMIVDTHLPWRFAIDPEKQQRARALARTHLEPKLSSRTKMIVK